MRVSANISDETYPYILRVMRRGTRVFFRLDLEERSGRETSAAVACTCAAVARACGLDSVRSMRQKLLLLLLLLSVVSCSGLLGNSVVKVIVCARALARRVTRHSLKVIVLDWATGGWAVDNIFNRNILLKVRLTALHCCCG